MPHRILAGVCLLVVGAYTYMGWLGGLEWTKLSPADAYYNLLVEGFRSGQLSLKKEIPLGFQGLSDPYDPVANQAYRILPDRMDDLSYYRGKLYIYFGATPALLLYWPFVAVTGRYLFDRQAVTIFCAIGFLASAGLVRAMWRRYFAEVSVWVVAACALALSFAAIVPTLLPISDVREVSISCGYALAMLALAALWKALQASGKRSGWLAGASLAYGLAVGARPSLLFGALILLVPVMQARRERQRVWTPLIAAVVPVALIGSGVMLYNALRFGSPFEFGWRYQLAGVSQYKAHPFQPGYLWHNFQVYFLAPARWSGRFPFVRDVAPPPVPEGYGPVEHPFGVLTNIPLAWLALAAPLAWRRRSVEARSVLCVFVAAVGTLFGIGALTLALFWAAAIRYEVEFLPALVVLAVIGILSLENMPAPTSRSKRIRGRESGQAAGAAGRCAARWCWGLLLGVSVAFNLLVSAESWAYAGCALGTVLADEGHLSEGIQTLRNALLIKSDYADGQQELSHALYLDGQFQEATEHGEQALRLNPDSVVAHNDVALALFQVGRLHEAIEHWEQALRIQPDYAELHNNLGNALLQASNVQGAIAQYQQALRIRPDFAEALYNLGNALEEADRRPEAIAYYEHALRLKPDFVQAQNALARARADGGPNR